MGNIIVAVLAVVFVAGLTVITKLKNILKNKTFCRFQITDKKPPAENSAGGRFLKN